MKARVLVMNLVCLLLMLGGCGQSGVELPESVIGEDLRLLVHLDVAAADADSLGQSFDAMYDVIPASDSTQRLRLMLDGLRDEAKQRYARIHKIVADAGIGVIVIGMHKQQEEPFFLVRAGADASPSDLIKVVERIVGETPPAEFEQAIQKLDGGWFAFAPVGEVPSDGNAEQADIWGRYLEEAGDAPLRIVIRMDENTVVGLNAIMTEASHELGSPELASDMRETLPDLDRVSIALHLGSKPKLVTRNWHTNAEAAEQHEAHLQSLVSQVRGRAKLALASMDAASAPSPEAVDALFNHLSIERQADRLEMSLTLDVVRDGIDMLAKSPMLAEMQDEFSREMQYMFR